MWMPELALYSFHLFIYSLVNTIKVQYKVGNFVLQKIWHKKDFHRISPQFRLDESEALSVIYSTAIYLRKGLLYLCVKSRLFS